MEDIYLFMSMLWTFSPWQATIALIETSSYFISVWFEELIADIDLWD